MDSGKIYVHADKQVLLCLNNVVVLVFKNIKKIKAEEKVESDSK